MGIRKYIIETTKSNVVTQHNLLDSFAGYSKITIVELAMLSDVDFYNRLSDFNNHLKLDNTSFIERPNSGIFGKGNSNSSACGELSLGLPFAQSLYFTGTFGVGTIVFTNTELTIPLTGFLCIAYGVNSTIYNVNVLTGQVKSITGTFCI